MDDPMIRETYSRDKRSPKPSSEQVSKIMSKIKAKNTKPELKVRKLLWNNGYKGYRIAPKNLPGKPDICFVKKKISIFINGCYWHRCPVCNLNLPKNNTEFWENKFSKNIERDQRKIKDLENIGYKVFTIWECMLTKSTDEEILEHLRNILMQK